MIGSFYTSISGLTAATRRVEVASSNIVNAFDDAPGPGVGVPVPAVGPAAAAQAYGNLAFKPRDVVQTTTADGGTRADTVDRQPASTPVYMPDHPNADSQGLVSRPNVDVASEFVNMILAQRAYEASLKALQTRDQMLGTTIDARS